MSEFKLKLRSPEDREKYISEKIMELLAKNSKLESDLAECRKVLAFYADGRNYSETIDHPRALRMQCVRIALDGGERAKVLLTRLGGK